jgi:hypothetical protein
MSLRTCNVCGWVHFGVSSEYVENETAKMLTYFATLAEEKREDYYGSKNPSPHDYEHCFRCGGSYENFRDSLPTDCPVGCTINPILHV